MSVQIERYDGEKTGRYIVTFKEGVVGANFYQPLVEAANQPIQFDYRYDLVFDGFAAKLDEAALNHLQTSPEVESISEDVIMHTCDIVTQRDAPWGLARLSSKSALSGDTANLTFSYNYDDSAGAGVDIYIVDTGVRVGHTDFGGRARWAGVFGGYEWKDGHGHGTHVAGTTAGKKFGVAKEANVYAVKVLSDEGSGATSDIIAGLRFVLNQFVANGRRPTVINMSLGGPGNKALDKAIQKLVSEGVHVVVAAGNENGDARYSSPARVKEAITVGANTISDARAEFSNFGDAVDLFAPGDEIVSCGYKSDTDQDIHSGTSMATPHVAGLVAYLIKLRGNASPADMAKRLSNMALKGVLTDIQPGTKNLLAHNV